MKPPVPVAVGAVARLRKAHPCGSFTWKVTRIGADIGLRCADCGRRIMLPREEFERRLQILQSPSEAANLDENND